MAADRVYPAIDPSSIYASQSLRGKVVFITGASRGIGRTTAINFAKAGASIAISARSATALDETQALILTEVPDAKVEKFVVDVTKAQEVEDAVEATASKLGGLDIVIANAGYINTFDRRMSACLSFASHDDLSLSPSIGRAYFSRLVADV